MSRHVHGFSDRHPQMAQQIKSMASRSSAFSDMCTRFGRVWDSLNGLDREPVETTDVRREVMHLETLMLARMHAHLRV